ncbi:MULTISPECIES: hypothetical protein [Helicobacter]|uniref:hypothetical protein n=1 Tax=Helicobacter TaxID=209 RepID=UPI00261A22BF|nr:hypothetical protein [Helicobacter sp. UBA3407]
MEEKSININIKELLNEVAGALHRVIQHSYEPILMQCKIHSIIKPLIPLFFWW